MKHIRGTRKALSLTLLVAALILPAGFNKTAMANNSSKVNQDARVCEKEMTESEVDYSISTIKFFSSI
ncbi:MAG: hypothetical protein ABIQ31_17880 [Ferruginibacter sp.]